MNKELCFIIDNNELYLDKVLVSFNDIPIFFICRDNDRQLYLVLCSDLDQMEYIVVKQSVRSIWQMLIQKISMREALLDCETFWFIKSENSIKDDVVELLTNDKMDLDVLPIEGAMYEKISEEDSHYIEQITSEYLNQIRFGSNETIQNIIELALEILPSVLERYYQIDKYIEFGPSIKNLKSGIKTQFKDELTVEDQHIKKLSYEQTFDEPTKKASTVSLTENNDNNDCLKRNIHSVFAA